MKGLQLLHYNDVNVHSHIFIHHGRTWDHPDNHTHLHRPDDATHSTYIGLYYHILNTLFISSDIPQLVLTTLFSL